MQGSIQKQPRIRILPAFNVDGRLGSREADVDEAVKTVQSVLPQHVDGDIDVTITLLEKNLKIMADMVLMKEVSARLVRDVLDAMLYCDKFSLIINQLNFEIESLRNADDSLIGACTFISLARAGADVGIDEKIKEKMSEPFFTTKAAGNGLVLAIAYRIIKQHHGGKTRAENPVEQGMEVNIYLPLTKLEIVNMLSIPAG